MTFIGSGKLGLPDNAIVAFALGADMVNVAREAMLAVGCVQAQSATPASAPPASRPSARGLPTGWTRHKADRVANNIETLRRDLLKVSEPAASRIPA